MVRRRRAFRRRTTERAGAFGDSQWGEMGLGRAQDPNRESRPDNQETNGHAPLADTTPLGDCPAVQALSNS